MSVVIPVVDRPDCLGRAVRSACDQSFPIHEIIVVDDGSTTPVTLRALGTDDPRVRVLRLDVNGGPAAARSAGVAASSGELIAFLDSDDIWHRRKIADQIRTFDAEASRPGLVAVVCGWQSGPHEGAVTLTRIPQGTEELVDFASGCWFCPGSTLLIAREAFDAVGPFDPGLRRLEDLEWFLRFALAGGRLVTTPTIGAFIRRGRNSRTEAVDHSARVIRARYTSHLDPRITGTVRRRLRAWLRVERAVAALSGGAPLALVWHLGLSLLLVPRKSVELQRWWQVPSLANTRQAPERALGRSAVPATRSR